MTTSIESLERKIESAVERLVREHVAGVEVAAAAAVREGVRRAMRPVSTKPRDGEGGALRRSPSARRPRDVVAKLEEQLYQAICAHPGETMTVLARAVGTTPRELSRPATLLRHNGRVRSVGQRHATRYFPLGA